MNDNPEINSNQPIQVKVSRLAITAISLAILNGIILFSGLLLENSDVRNSRSDFWQILVFFILIISAISVILGVLSLIKIEMSGGKIIGRKFSVGAILIPIFIHLFPIVHIMPIAHRGVAYRMVCGTNLSGIGKAMLIYANDYDDEFPRAGGRGATWGNSVNYKATNPQKAFNISSTSRGSATISSSLYLLVKYAEVEPKKFICSEDKEVTEFYRENILDRIKKKIGKGNKIKRYNKILSYWDFGAEPWKHNSYSYHNPFGEFALTAAKPPDMAIMADRNPWIESKGWKVKDFSEFDPDGERKIRNIGNSPCHNDEGQNVLFLDTHVDFQTVSFCGVNDDNIYTSWNGDDIRKGTKPEFGSQPAGSTDSLLVNDPPK